MFAKELTLVGDTAATSGIGFFNGDLQGFEIAHKDTKRYPDETGGWAYYTFGHKPEPNACPPFDRPKSRVSNGFTCMTSYSL